MNKKNALILFAKNPESGKVKTRLAKSIGNEKALELYKKLLMNSYSQTKDTNCDKFLFLSDKTDQSLFDKSYRQYVQNGINLGERMKNAFNEIFNTGYDRILLIGTDIPGLTDKIIETGFLMLEKYGFIIGPATDGGYYLIGMNRKNESVFDSVEWSTDKVLKKTLQNICDLNETVFLLRELVDVDNVEDLKNLNLFSAIELI